jgi:hypothetical protein
MTSSELVHYGVKGMHWGSHRSSKQDRQAQRISRGKELVNDPRKIKSSAGATALRGAAEVTAILLIGSKVAVRIPASSNKNVLAGAQLTKLALAGKVGVTRIGQIRDINAYNKSNRKL